jgi:ribokinase
LNETIRAFIVGNYMNANFLFVPRLPRPGESVAAQGHFHEHGGKGLNLAIGLHRLGARADLLMAVGDDAPGRAIAALLDGMGMDVSGVRVVADASGFGVGFIAPEGRNFIAAYMGANLLLSPDHVEQARAAVEAADWCLAQFEAPEPAIAAAFAIAKASGGKTCLNPSPWREPAPDLLARTDVLVLNQTEAADFFGRPDLAEAEPDAAPDSTPNSWRDALPELAQRRGWRGELLVVTLADSGAVALDARGVAHDAPAFAVEPVDATGAGDAFTSGLVWSLARGDSVAEALRVGNACGALIVAGKGVLDHLPDPARLEAFIARYRQPA